MKMFLFLFCLIGFCKQQNAKCHKQLQKGASQQAEWSYEAQDQWPGVCTTGRYQSPINIVTRYAVLDTRGPLRLRGYRAVNTTAVNDGHTVMWSAVPGAAGAPRLSGGPLIGDYIFQQLHMHWRCEHTIDGYRYPLEIHFVHAKAGLTMDEALQRPDGIAVIGVICILRSGAEYALAQLMPALPYLVHPGDNYTQPEAIDLTRLLSPDPQSYYTYFGSLTTPDCQEVVTWILLDQPLPISNEQYEQIRKTDIGGSEFNYRSLQRTGLRVVYHRLGSI